MAPFCPAVLSNSVQRSLQRCRQKYPLSETHFEFIIRFNFNVLIFFTVNIDTNPKLKFTLKKSLFTVYYSV